jgi:hypothetical protein
LAAEVLDLVDRQVVRQAAQAVAERPVLRVQLILAVAAVLATDQLLAQVAVA